MHVIAALGDAPTAAIAVVAIALGLFLAARGPREKRATAAVDNGEAPGPAMVTLPAATAPEATAPETEPGFVGPAGDVVGHGPIRLGTHGPLGAGEETASPPAAPPAAPEVQAADEPEAGKDPAWRVAARAANSAVHFRQGTIKIGGRPAGKRKDQ